MPTPTVIQLQRAIQISEQIEKLQSELAAIFGGQSVPVKGKRTMSPEGRARIAAAQRARWVKLKGTKSTPAVKKEKPAKKKRVVSPEARAKMAEAAKKRWAEKKKA